MSDDTCGAPTNDGGECSHPPTEPDGFCWMHTDTTDEKRPGRDPKLTKERQEQIAADIENGSSITAACRKAGISKPTFYNWMDAGEEQAEGIFAEFFDRIVRARGEGEDYYRRVAFDMAREEGDTATLMAMLKQRYPESWGDVNRGEQAGGVTVNASDPDEYEIDPDSLEVVDE